MIFLIFAAVKVTGLLFNLDKKDGKTLEELGLIDEAIVQYRVELHSDPGNNRKRFALGCLYQLKGLLEEAIRELECISASSPVDPKELEEEVFKNLCVLCRNAKRPDKEFKYLNKLLRLGYADTQFEFRLSEFFIANRQLKESITLLDGIIRDNNEYLDEALYRKGMVMIESGKMFDIGIDSLKKALLINPEHLGALEALAFCHMKTDPETARDYFSRAIKSTQELTEKIVWVLMTCYIKSQKHDWQGITNELMDYLVHKERINLSDRVYMLFALASSYYLLNEEEVSSEYWIELLKNDFGYIELYDVVKSPDTAKARMMILRCWDILFMEKKCPKLSSIFRSCQLNDLITRPDISEISRIFNKWIRSTGQTRVNPSKKPAKQARTFSYPANARALMELSNYEFCQVIRKIVESMDITIEHEFKFGAGFEAIVNTDSTRALLLSRKWAGNIGEIQVDQLITYISKRKYRNGIIIACGSFSPQAQKKARKNAIRIIDGHEIDAYLEQLNRN